MTDEQWEAIDRLREAVDTFSECLQQVLSVGSKRKNPKPQNDKKLIDGYELTQRLLDEAITDNQRQQANHLRAWITNNMPEAVVRCRDCEYYDMRSVICKRFGIIRVSDGVCEKGRERA